MHRPVQVTHSSFIEGSLTTKNTATVLFQLYLNLILVEVKNCGNRLSNLDQELLSRLTSLQVPNAVTLFTAVIQDCS
jgi:hypothetical protein